MGDRVPSAPEILFSVRTLHYEMEMGDVKPKELRNKVSLNELDSP